VVWCAGDVDVVTVSRSHGRLTGRLVGGRVPCWSVMRRCASPIFGQSRAAANLQLKDARLGHSTDASDVSITAGGCQSFTGGEAGAAIFTDWS